MPPSQPNGEFDDIWEVLAERLWHSLRARINAHPRAVIAAAVGSTILLLIIVIALLTPDKRPPVQDIETEWYYDLNTGKLFTAAKGLTPPIEAPSGPQPNGEPAGVRAYVLTYSHASDKSGRYIGFLETSAPKELAAHWPTRPAHTNPASQWGRGKLIRRVDDEKWALADSKEGRQIFEEAFAPNADGERPISCPPE